MKKLLLSCLFLCYFASLTAQYDFPVVVHGLSISLDLDGNKVVYPQQWLANSINDCLPDSLLISETVFPRTNRPPATAADSMVFNCENFSSESVEIWWKGAENEWLVTDSYALISGFDGCDCDSNCLENAKPVLINGYSTAYENGGNIVIHARELVNTYTSGYHYSFGPAIADSSRTFSCTDGLLSPVDIYAHADGLESRSAQTYITFDTSNCSSTSFPGASARVVQGLSIPSGLSGMISVPARAFAVPYGPEQILAFSENVNDTIFSINCENIGGGGINIALYNHIDGNPGPPARTYLIGNDGRGFCNGDDSTIPRNDHRTNATLLDECTVFEQFHKASIEPQEISIDSSGAIGATVWYQFPLEDANEVRYNVTIRPLDSIYFSFYAPIDGLLGPSDPLSHGLITGDTTINLCWDGGNFDLWSLQIQQAAPNQMARYYLSLGEQEVCQVATENQQQLDKTVHIAPNPSNGLFNLITPDPSLQIASINVFSTSGQALLQQSNPLVDLSNQPAGLYWVVIYFENGQRVSKRLIKR